MYTYGAVNALGANQVASIDGPLANDTVQFGYDSLQRMTTSAVNGISQNIVYDALNRVTQVANPLGAFNYIYLRNTGRLTGVSYPNGQTSLYTYYGGSGGTVEPRLQQIQNLDASGSAPLSQFNYEYDANGQISRWTQAQSGNSSGDYNYTYDAAGRLIRSLLGSAVSGLVTNSEYVYDDSDNRITEQRDQNVMHADYNNLNQLTTRSGGGVIPVRGKVSKPSNVAVNGKAANVDTNNVPWKFWAQVPVNVGTNQFTIVAKDGSGNASTNTYQLVISGGSGGSYTYDANGNLTSDGARTYAWDAENRLASVTVNGNTSEFTYDGLGRRVKEKVNGTLTKQWIWIGTVLAEERDGSNNVAKRFCGIGEEILGVPYYYTLDHLGSVREMSDANGNVVAQYQYDSWGRKTKIAGSLDSSFGYTGHYYHASSGLNFTLYRAYDSDTGRWQSRDPIEEKGGMNLYGYVLNNPIYGYDLLGLKTCWKKMLITAFNDRTGSHDNRLGPGSAAVADSRYRTTDFDYNPRTDSNHLNRRAYTGRAPTPYAIGSRFTIYPNGGGNQNVAADDVGSGWAAPRPRMDLPNGVKDNEWLDRWTPRGNEDPEWAWVSIEVDDCQNCPSGWSG